MSRVRPSSSALGKSNEDLKIVNAEVAQLVERQPSKLNVASSTLVFRSKTKPLIDTNINGFFNWLNGELYAKEESRFGYPKRLSPIMKNYITIISLLRNLHLG